MLDGAPGVLGLLVLAGREAGKDGPAGQKDRNGGEEGKEDGRLQPPTNLPGQVGGHTGQEGEQDLVGERIISTRIGRQWGILNGWVLRRGVSDDGWEGGGSAGRPHDGRPQGSRSPLRERTEMEAYRSCLDTTSGQQISMERRVEGAQADLLFELLKVGGGSFGGVDELEIALGAVSAGGIGRHGVGAALSSLVEGCGEGEDKISRVSGVELECFCFGGAFLAWGTGQAPFGFGGSAEVEVCGGG